MRPRRLPAPPGGTTVYTDEEGTMGFNATPGASAWGEGEEQEPQKGIDALVGHVEGDDEQVGETGSDVTRPAEVREPRGVEPTPPQ